jgi:hypothetical protein
MRCMRSLRGRLLSVIRNPCKRYVLAPTLRRMKAPAEHSSSDGAGQGTSTALSL